MKANETPTGASKQERPRAMSTRGSTLASKDHVSALNRRAAQDALDKSLAAKPASGFRVGAVTEEDKYGPVSVEGQCRASIKPSD